VLYAVDSPRSSGLPESTESNKVKSSASKDSNSSLFIIIGSCGSFVILIGMLVFLLRRNRSSSAKLEKLRQQPDPMDSNNASTFMNSSESSELYHKTCVESGAYMGGPVNSVKNNTFPSHATREQQKNFQVNFDCFGIRTAASQYYVNGESFVDSEDSITSFSSRESFQKWINSNRETYDAFEEKDRRELGEPSFVGPTRNEGHRSHSQGTRASFPMSFRVSSLSGYPCSPIAQETAAGRRSSIESYDI